MVMKQMKHIKQMKQMNIYHEISLSMVFLLVSPLLLVSQAQGSPVNSSTSHTQYEQRTSLKNIAFTSISAISDFHMTAGAQFRVTGQDQYQLDEGSILVNSPRAIKIDTPNCQLEPIPNSAIIVTVTNHETKLLDLSDHFNKPSKVFAGTQTLNLGPGQELDVLSESMERAQAIVNDDELPRRNVETTVISDNLCVVQAEFSLPAVLAQHPLFLELRESGSKNDRQLCSRIMKTATIIQEVFDRTRGPYAVPMFAQHVESASKGQIPQ